MIEWTEWGPDAFARASCEAKPILLSITAAWCRACHEMDRTTYADPEVAALIRDRFVAVRVDTDRRPDINERYNLGGWPTTAFLTPDGRLISGATFVPVERMAGVLSRVATAFESRASELAALAADYQAAEHTEKAATESTEDTDLVGVVFATFDEEYGGFGIEPKFPHTAPVHLALALFRETGESRWPAIAEKTLDAIADGGLWDREGGGFYRYAATRDWRLPHVEKLLETNAALLRLYAEAAVVLGRSVDRDRIAAIAGFITGTLRADGGGYYGSESDRVLYADANATAASALLAASAALGDHSLTKEALASFERVVLACYRPGQGVAHYFDGAARVRGLLSDQIASLTALLDAHDVTDGEPYQMMAEELGHYAIREMWDARGEGFFDRAGTAEDVGLLRSRRKPGVANADAAVALTRLQRVSREFDFSDYAAGALRASAAEARRHGPLAAHYVLAARQLG